MRFLRFLIAGGLNTAFSYALFSCLVYVGVDNNISVTICYIIGVVFNYKTIGSLAFKDKSKKSFINFLAIYVCSYFLNIIALDMLVNFGLSAYLAALIIAAPLAVVVFLLNKRYVFS